MAQIKLPLRVADFKDRSGNWVLGYGRSGNTVSGKRWKDMLFRCTSTRYPAYQDCSVGFENFQEFADWSQSQVGVLNSDWQLDKDLLVNGNKIYSSATCLFLPRELNCFILGHKNTRGKYLKGVSFKASGQKYVAQCNRGAGVPVRVGAYETELEAHQAYKVFKECFARELAEIWRDKIDPRAYNALMEYTVNLED